MGKVQKQQGNFALFPYISERECKCPFPRAKKTFLETLDFQEVPFADLLKNWEWIKFHA